MQEKMHKQYRGGSSGGGFQYREYHFGGQPRNSTTQPEGKITVDYIPPTEKKKPNLDKGGEFVDFVEVNK